MTIARNGGILVNKYNFWSFVRSYPNCLIWPEETKQDLLKTVEHIKRKS